MALQLGFQVLIKPDCKGFLITELTESYSIDNIGGWGDPNLELGDIAEGHLTITNTTTGVIYDNIPWTFTDDDTIVTEVNAPFSVNEVEDTCVCVTDGIYCLEFFVIGVTNDTYNATNKLLTLADIECKLKDLALQLIKLADCEEDKKCLIDKFLEAKAYYSAINYNFICGNHADANKLIVHLCEFLSEVNCKNC